MSSVIKHKGALYVEADSAEGFSDDLNHFAKECLPQVEALLGRARKLKMKTVGGDLQRLLEAVKIFSKREPPDLETDKTQEMPVAASIKKG
jgi:hypothetical protein